MHPNVCYIVLSHKNFSAEESVSFATLHFRMLNKIYFASDQSSDNTNGLLINPDANLIILSISL